MVLKVTEVAKDREIEYYAWEGNYIGSCLYPYGLAQAYNIVLKR